MARTIGIGIQNFEKMITNDYFYIDKTLFIKEWWESGDDVTLITRPRRFGKTLNINMLERFFSVEYAGCGEVFEGLSIYLAGEKISEAAGNIPGDQSLLCCCERAKLSGCEGKNLSADYRAIY